MKSKKVKKAKPIVHTNFPFTPDQCDTLSNALDFLMNYDTFSFEDAKISRDCAFAAAEKMNDRFCTLTRGEVRAAAVAVDITLQALADISVDFSHIENDFPGIISDLKTNLSTLEFLRNLLIEVVKDLQKTK